MDTVSTASPAEPDNAARFGFYESLQTDGQMLAVRLIKLLHRMADRSGMNPTDFQCYTLLRVAGTMTPGEIATSLCLSTGSVTGVIDRMEAHGLVERTRHPEDRRKIAVRLTEGAGHMNAALAPGMRQAMTELHDGYSPQELAVIVDWLSRVGRTLDGLTERP
ncbi:MarR family winged helix-turn-helix transcriptional regulator [Nocardiopsis lambiniae]|uniref:MarR family transcriptional regulator n=1 Tax=Nocardiopsis lambiniae TaxID=3075539 RepID=A0ABU2MDB5_9ACTN|nr:MarR family transcriptional regulator [Nocardiopsis sp. DSM 44743]MDT0330676.1 MarR family transcriptional regulator [Nocardiopsis sp. DSM 44743]